MTDDPAVVAVMRQVPPVDQVPTFAMDLAPALEVPVTMESLVMVMKALTAMDGAAVMAARHQKLPWRT